MIGALEKVGLLIPFWPTPFVLGENWDKTASVLDRLLPHRTVKIITTCVVHYAKANSLEAPFHRDQFTGWNFDMCLIRSSD